MTSCGRRLAIRPVDRRGEQTLVQRRPAPVVDRRLRETIPGCSIVAVGENPMHTLRARGIYSITLADKYVLDQVLAASSGALVLAGLLFDQGIRWSIGKAELCVLDASHRLGGHCRLCGTRILK